MALSASHLRGQSASAVEPATTTLHVSTQIVLLDVAVIDKKGRPANVRLDRDDFAVTEDGQAQRILSFEAPSQASASTHVFVLDQLNTAPADRAYYLISFQNYLRSLPETLANPTEFMVLTDTVLKIVQPATRKRADLLSAVAHLPGTDATMVNLESERLNRTLSALEQIALEGLGDPAKTAVVWLGPGYGIDFYAQPLTRRSQTQQYIRYLTNTFLESRMTLHVLFPPDFVLYSGFHLGSDSQAASAADPYGSGFNLRTLAAETGGSVYTATNDLVTAMRQALDLERGSYRLTYRPSETVVDGKFRHIRVTLRNPNLRVVTKSGYYAPEVQEQNTPQAMQVFQMAEAANATLPFQKLPLRVTHIDRSADGKSAEFTLFAEGKDLPWRPDEQETSLSEFTVGGLGLSKEGKRLSSNFRNVAMMTRSQDPLVLAGTTASFKLTLELPANVDRVRLVISSQQDGRLGCVDVDRAALTNATMAQRVPAPKP
ncbi:VWA domain-containing protein [Terriglobus aquaticus]|uniref:VWA domain-containing protein n=1 Tax=Terriglobus aquaticus TaxID=940139 RepID=A0ABW9KHT2_9BACT